MATYLMKFVPNFSAKTQPLQELLKSKKVWHWNPRMTDTFHEIKHSLTTAHVLHYLIQPNQLPLPTDASFYGIGSILLQSGPPVAYVSAALIPVQQRYSQIETELLDVVLACEQLYYYICGRSMVVETDHKPIICVHSKEFHNISLELQHRLLWLQHSTIRSEDVPGKKLTVADALLHAPHPKKSIETADDEHGILVCMLVKASTPKVAKIRDNAAADYTLQCVTAYIQKGWPEQVSSIAPSVKLSQSISNELYMMDGFILYGE